VKQKVPMLQDFEEKSSKIKIFRKKEFLIFFTFLSNLSQIWLIPLVNDLNVSTSQNSHQKKGKKISYDLCSTAQATLVPIMKGKERKRYIHLMNVMVHI
jgi:hypothetical protein